MNREIKFRAWETEEGRFRMFSWKEIRNEFISWTNCKDTILMQFTGLRDKNGKEIYEGDYFQVAYNKIYTVKWLDVGESNFETYAATFILWLNDETFFPFDEFAIKTGEVIGNIYENENPELLNP